MEQRTGKGRQKLRMGDILVQQNVVTEEKLQTALKKQRGSGKKLGEVLVEMNFATEEAIGQALSRQLGYKFVNLNGLTIPEKVIKLDAVLGRALLIVQTMDEEHGNGDGFKG